MATIKTATRSMYSTVVCPEWQAKKALKNRAREEALFDLAPPITLYSAELVCHLLDEARVIPTVFSVR